VIETRRGLLSLALGVTPGFAATPPAASLAADLPGLQDPAKRASAWARVMGTLGNETVWTLVRLHIYGYRNDGNLTPFFDVLTTTASTWSRIDATRYAMRTYETGIVYRFDTNEPLETWTNPFTGETRRVFHHKAGPFEATIGPDGLEPGPQITMRPKPMTISAIEDTVYFTGQSAFSFPTPFPPAAFPTAPTGERLYLDSHFTFTAPRAALLDESRASVPRGILLNNLFPLSPWMGVGGIAGRTFGRGVGRKLSDEAALPAHVRAANERFAPALFDRASWTERYDETAALKMFLAQENPEKTR
jgi:hypothetical protein